MGESIFKVGDIVEAFGCRGVVYEILDTNEVRVFFDRDCIRDFKIDGKCEAWHEAPSLKLISRPNKSKFIDSGGGVGIMEIVEVIGLGPAIEVEVDE